LKNQNTELHNALQPTYPDNNTGLHFTYKHNDKNRLLTLKRETLPFLFIFLIPLIADAIYSITDFRAGIFYRGITYIAVMAYIALIPLKKYKTLSYLCLYPIILALFSSIIYGEITLGLAEAAKYSYVFAITILLVRNSKYFTKIKLINYSANVGFAASLLILVPFLLGIGKSTYFEGAYGNKGFFSAQNDISITLAICLTLAASQYTSNRTIFNLLKALSIGISMIVLGTRLSLILAITIPLFFLLKLQFKVIAIASLLVILSASSLYKIAAEQLSFSDYESQKFENISFGDKGRMTLLTGANIFFENRSIVAHLFGSGTFEYLSQTYKNLKFLDLDGELKAVEMDPIDLFGQYGVIFTATLYIYLLSILCRLSKLQKKSKETKAVIVTISLVILNSTFVGHTINNTIAAPVIASLLAISLIILKEKNQNR
jgi:hypothetical protein